MGGSPSIWPALLAFMAVIAMIPAVLWMLKRLQGGLKTGSQGITLRAGLALGPRERVAIIEVQGRRFLVGVTAQTVNLIAELQASETTSSQSTDAIAMAGLGQGKAIGTDPAPGMTPTANGFAELLSRLKRP